MRSNRNNMRVHECPKCGRMPKINECCASKYGDRRRICMCPNYCSVIPNPETKLDTFCFIFVGDGDDNRIFKIWNAAIERYESEKGMPFHTRDWSPISDDPNLEKYYY